MKFTLESMKERFRHNLIASWTTQQGTFNAVMGESWTFYSDGKGERTSYSGMSGTEVQKFIWKESKKEFSISIKFGKEKWENIEYDFKIIKTDVGDSIVLHSKGQDNFFDALAPLSFAGLIRGNGFSLA
ncbi:MAG: hypothetical protein ABII22_05075 [Candidatus Micrarchaeota archaeon]